MHPPDGIEYAPGGAREQLSDVYANDWGVRGGAVEGGSRSSGSWRAGRVVPSDALTITRLIATTRTRPSVGAAGEAVAAHELMQWQTGSALAGPSCEWLAG